MTGVRGGAMEGIGTGVGIGVERPPSAPPTWYCAWSERTGRANSITAKIVFMVCEMIGYAFENNGLMFCSTAHVTPA